jgi:hypothetical protein
VPLFTVRASPGCVWTGAFRRPCARTLHSPSTSPVMGRSKRPFNAPPCAGYPPARRRERIPHHPALGQNSLRRCDSTQQPVQACEVLLVVAAQVLDEAGQRDCAVALEHATTLQFSIRTPIDQRQRAMCALVNSGELIPRPIAVLFATAIHKARHDAGSWISAGECLVRIAQHFVNVSGARLNKRFPRPPH